MVGRSTSAVKTATPSGIQTMNFPQERQTCKIRRQHLKDTGETIPVVATYALQSVKYPTHGGLYRS